MMQTPGLVRAGAERAPLLSRLTPTSACTSKRDGEGARPPVLVLALGNRLLTDDGVGAELLSLLELFSEEWGPDVELLDGGTCGLALLGEVQDRSAVVFLDAIKLGAEPGSVHVVRKRDLLGMGSRTSATAHEGGVKDILAVLELVGGTPEQVTVVGVEPASLETGIGVSEKVKARLGEAMAHAREEICAVVESVRTPPSLAGLARSR